VFNVLTIFTIIGLPLSKHRAKEDSAQEDGGT
jgi:hypothetical protein